MKLSALGVRPFICSVFSGRCCSSKFGRDTRFPVTSPAAGGGNFGSSLSIDKIEARVNCKVSIRGVTHSEVSFSKNPCEVLASDFEFLLKSLRQDDPLLLL